MPPSTQILLAVFGAFGDDEAADTWADSMMQLKNFVFLALSDPGCTNLAAAVLRKMISALPSEEAGNMFINDKGLIGVLMLLYPRDEAGNKECHACAEVRLPILKIELTPRQSSELVCSALPLLDSRNAFERSTPILTRTCRLATHMRTQRLFRELAAEGQGRLNAVRTMLSTLREQQPESITNFLSLRALLEELEGMP